MSSTAVRPRLRRKEAARYLLDTHGVPVAVSTLEKFATNGGGPGFQKFGHIPLYPTEELDRWAREKLGKVLHSTSEESAP